MKLGIITSYPPSKVTLNEYGYYLVKNFVEIDEISEITVYSDRTDGDKWVDFDDHNKLTFKDCWEFNGYFNLFKILYTVLNDAPDAVLINGQFMKFGDQKIPAALGLFTGWFLKILGIPSIFLIHNILEKVDLDKAGFTSNKWLTKIYQGIGNLLTEIILNSSLVAVTIKKYVEILQNKYQKENIINIPHGSFEIPPLLPPKKFDEKVIMTFGKFGTYKKVEPMIDAVELLRKRNPDLKLKIVIAGTDNPNVKGYLDQVKTKYEHVNNLHFTGYVEEAEVPHLFADSTVVVFPYTSTTGSSGVLHQAGSYGKAAILPKIDDLAYLIEKEGYKGEYFKPNDANELSYAIEKIVTDDEYRRSLEVANYEAATELPMIDICYMYLQYFKGLLIFGEENSLKSLH